MSGAAKTQKDPAKAAAAKKKKRLRKKQIAAAGAKAKAADEGGGSGDESGSYHSEGTVACSDSDFEGHDGYRKGGYHPVHVGEVYGGRFAVLRKLGWGHFSTVWLAADAARGGAHVAMKVQKSAAHYTEAAFDEIDILRTLEREAKAVQAEMDTAHAAESFAARLRAQRSGERIKAAAAAATAAGASMEAPGVDDGAWEAELAKVLAAAAAPLEGEALDAEEAAIAREVSAADPASLLAASEGAPVFNPYVVRLLDHFFHEGPHGKHMVMVFNLLGDNLLALIKAYRYAGIPARIVRRFTAHVCSGLHFLHARCGVIHTDLKPENVLLSEKLPPVPLPVEECEGVEEIEEDMTLEEEAAAEARERTRSRKLGLLLGTQGAGSQSARAMGGGVSGSDAPVVDVEGDPEFILGAAGLRGEARRKFKRRFVAALIKRRVALGALSSSPAAVAAASAAVTAVSAAALLASNFVLRPVAIALSGGGDAVDAASWERRAWCALSDYGGLEPLALNPAAIDPPALTATPISEEAAAAAEGGVGARGSGGGLAVLVFAEHSHLAASLGVGAPEDGSAMPALPTAWRLVVAIPGLQVLASAEASGSSASCSDVAPLLTAAASSGGGAVGAGLSKKARQRARRKAAAAAEAGGGKEGDGDIEDDEPPPPPPPFPDASAVEAGHAGGQHPLAAFYLTPARSSVPAAGSVLSSLSFRLASAGAAFAGSASAATAGFAAYTAGASSVAVASAAAPSADSSATPCSLSPWLLRVPAAVASGPPALLAHAIAALECALPGVAFLWVPCPHTRGSTSLGFDSASTMLLRCATASAALVASSASDEPSEEGGGANCKPPAPMAAPLPPLTGESLTTVLLGVQLQRGGELGCALAACSALVAAAATRNDPGAPFSCADLFSASAVGYPPFIQDLSGSGSRASPLPAGSDLQPPAQRLLLRPPLARVASWLGFSAPSRAASALLTGPGRSAGSGLSLGMAHGVYWAALSEALAEGAAAAAMAPVAALTADAAAFTAAAEDADASIAASAAAAAAAAAVAAEASDSAVPLLLLKRRKKLVKRPRELSPEEAAAAAARYASEWAAWEAVVARMDAYIVDVGNACWVHKHFSEDIQTRQYRAPEVVLCAGYDESADVWSLACMVFECLTGDLLFDPAASDGWDRDEDHLAQMQELLGPFPLSVALRGKRAREFFNRRGELRHIKDLRFWGPAQVVGDKYHFSPADAAMFQAWLVPALSFYRNRRATALECLRHPWLATVPGGDGSFVDWGADPALTMQVLQDLAADGQAVAPRLPGVPGFDSPLDVEEAEDELAALEALREERIEAGDFDTADAIEEELVSALAAQQGGSNDKGGASGSSSEDLEGSPPPPPPPLPDHRGRGMERAEHDSDAGHGHKHGSSSSGLAPEEEDAEVADLMVQEAALVQLLEERGEDGAGAVDDKEGEDEETSALRKDLQDVRSLIESILKHKSRRELILQQQQRARALLGGQQAASSGSADEAGATVALPTADSDGAGGYSILQSLCYWTGGGAPPAVAALSSSLAVPPPLGGTGEAPGTDSSASAIANAPSDGAADAAALGSGASSVNSLLSMLRAIPRSIGAFGLGGSDGAGASSSEAGDEDDSGVATDVLPAATGADSMVEVASQHEY